MKSKDLWEFRPSWFPHQTLVANNLLKWHPPPQINLDLYAFRQIIHKAKEQNAEWLRHPCVSALEIGNDELFISVQGLIWITKNNPMFSWSVVINRTLSIWTPDGGQTIDPGSYTSPDLTNKLSDYSKNILVDLWALSLGKQYEHTLSLRDNLSAEMKVSVNQGLTNMLSAIDKLQRNLPECFEWFKHGTQVIIPLVRQSDGHVRSSSRLNCKGVIFCDFTSAVNLWEAFIHETAHQHFYLTEMNLPLIADENARFYSPLRKKLRPIKGVFLAYHALVHIRKFYLDAIAINLIPSEILNKNLAIIERDLSIARKSMQQGYLNLTNPGHELFNLLEEKSS